MTSALARRLDRLESARQARIPLRCLILRGTADENRAEYHRVFAEGRITAREPVLMVTNPAGIQGAMQMRLSERLAKLERAARGDRPAQRILQHVLDCAPVERPARIASIKAADPSAFHVVRVIVRPGEQAVAAWAEIWSGAS